MKKILNMLFKNIKEEKGTFFSSIISYILIFTLVNIFVFGVLNTNAYRLKQEQTNQLIVYLNNKTTEDEKKEFQIKLLNLEGVSSIRYVSKDLALKSLEKELNVDLSKEENPLEDAFFVYLSRNVNIENLEKELNTLSEISEFDMRSKVINQTVTFSNILDSVVKNSSIALAIFSVIMIFNISMLTIKTRKSEIYVNLKNNKEVRILKTAFFIENLISILIASIFSYTIYTYIKKAIIRLASQSFVDYVIPDTISGEISVLLIVLAVAIIMSILINYLFLNKYYNIEYYEKELVELKEEIEELEKEHMEEIIENNKKKLEDEEDFEEFIGGK